MNSLRTRLLMGVLSAMTLAWIVVAVAGYFESRHELNELLDAHLAQSAGILLAQLSRGDEAVELEHAPQLHRYARKVAFQLWEHGRDLRLHSLSAPSTKLSDSEEGFSFGGADGKQWRVFSAWNRESDTQVQVAELVEARDEVSGEIALNLLIPIGLSLPLIGFILALAIGKGLKPLNELAQEVSGRDSRRLEPIGVGHTPAEVRPLVEQLNALFDRIGQTLENERRFTADASHELRTPIAAIRAQTQVARQARNDGERLHALNNVVAGCDRATHLIEQMLTLARLESGKWPLPVNPVDLAAMARSMLAELGQYAHSKGVGLELDAAKEAVVKGHETLLGILLRNLVDNGIRYSPAGTKLTVRVGETASGTRLEVTDQGPGIVEMERDRVLNRFYRILGSGESGSGLGLSIVARIAALHGATLNLADGDGGPGLKVSVEFPNRVEGSHGSKATTR
ncbi:MAG: ATP-binding protein [Methylococcaceae bacterium]|nr:ATP-binding protein [Methylococcaceae bacterium]